MEAILFAEEIRIGSVYPKAAMKIPTTALLVFAATGLSLLLSQLNPGYT